MKIDKGIFCRRRRECVVSAIVCAAIFYHGHASCQENLIAGEGRGIPPASEALSATGYYKSISDIAENMTVITANQIAKMNAHSVWEILIRVPGIIVSTSREFGAGSLLHIQGSEDYHVTVFVDGVKWNFLSGGNAETNSIPVDTIERIEIIKGPASSKWGSALGGVVNIITRQIGYAFDGPEGAVKMSFGEKNTQDHSAWIEGMFGNASLYLFGGRQESDGLRASRFFENNSFFSKGKIRITQNAEFNASFGYSEPYLNIGDYDTQDFTAKWRERVLFSKADFQYSLPFDFSLNVSARHLKRKGIQTNDVLGLGRLGLEGELYQDGIYEEETTGGGANLLWRKDKHTVIFGAELDKAELVQTLESGSHLQASGAPPMLTAEPDMESRAAYLNDTILIGDWAVTPGIRYDYNDIVGSFVSPSLGITYALGMSSVFRVYAGRGFTTPPLNFTSAGGIFLHSNPNLCYEKVWSYQVGAESKIQDYLWVKATLFRNDLEDVLSRETIQPDESSRFINAGKNCRQGFELEIETTPFHSMTVSSGFSYTHLNSSIYTDESKDRSTWTAALKYEDYKSLNAQLQGVYIHWFSKDDTCNSDYGGFICNFTANKKIEIENIGFLSAFFSIHNIFNDSQYPLEDLKNPNRWTEFGFKYQF